MKVLFVLFSSLVFFAATATAQQCRVTQFGSQSIIDCDQPKVVAPREPRDTLFQNDPFDPTPIPRFVDPYGRVPQRQDDFALAMERARKSYEFNERMRLDCLRYRLRWINGRCEAAK